MPAEGRIHSIETCGTVDGPGIRFVVFMQGCPMRCLYCHNPDTWSFDAGIEMTAEEIIKRFIDLKEFYKNGGITVTGGEPLAQIDFLTDLFKKCKENNIHTCIDTSGITFNPENTEKVDCLLNYTNLVLLDIKHIDDGEHKKLTGYSNQNILAFARYLSQKKVKTWIRHVTVPGITYNEEHLKRLGGFLKTLENIEALDVLPYHDAGKIKYEKLKADYPLKRTPVLTKEEALKARNIIINAIKENN